jgi:hypothetical protein
MGRRWLVDRDGVVRCGCLKRLIQLIRVYPVDILMDKGLGPGFFRIKTSTV